MTPRRPRRALPALRLAATALILLLSAGCGAAADGTFDSQSTVASPTCLVHQARTPGRKYTSGEQSDTALILQMMRFYTANGRKGFCDGKPATSADRQWMSLYTSLGGDPRHLRSQG